MNFENVEKKVLECGAKSCEFNKEGFKIYWNTREEMRKAAKICKSREIFVTQAQQKCKDGWLLEGKRF